MRTRVTITVSADRDDATRAVKTFFETSSRWKGVLSEVEHTLAKSRRGRLATGGTERLEVDVRPAERGSVPLEVTSQTGPAFDWGQNARNIRSLVRFLESSGIDVVVGPMTSTHSIWREGLGGSGT